MLVRRRGAMKAAMSVPDNPYEPPHADVASPHTTFSPNEWRTMAKVFGGWLVGAAIVTGIGLTIQTAYALRAFSVQSRVGGIVVVSALREVGPMVVFMAASVAMSSALDKRVWQSIPPPTSVVHGLAMIVLLAGFFIANGVIAATSFLTAMMSEGGSARVFIESIRATVSPHDPAHGMMKCSSVMMFGILVLPRVARWFAGLQRGNIFKSFLLIQGFGFVMYVVGRFLITVEAWLE